MPILDLSRPSGACDATLSACVIRTDAGADSLTYRLDLSMPVSSRTEAEAIEDTMPGLAEAYDRAVETENKWKATFSIRPEDSLRVCIVRHGTSEPVIQGQAEITEIKATQSKRAQVLILRLTYRGHGADVAERLAANLGRLVGVTFERAQGVLDFASAAASAKVPSLRVGMVVAASLSDGSQVVGRVMEIDGGVLSVHERGADHSVEREAVISAYSFSDDSETSAALTDYAERCRRRGVAVSWACLTTALSGTTSGASVRVTAEHVERAVELVAHPTLPLDRPGEQEAQEDAGAEQAGPRIVEVIETIPVSFQPARGGRKPRAAARA